MQIGLVTLGDWLPDPATGRRVSEAERFRQFVELGVLAEELGFDTFHVGEHHFSEYALSAPCPCWRGGRADHPAAPLDRRQPARPPRPGERRRGLRDRRRAVRRPGRADRRPGRLPAALPPVRPVVGGLRGAAGRGGRSAAPALDRGGGHVVGRGCARRSTPSPSTPGPCSSRTRRSGSRPARRRRSQRAVALGCPIAIPTISTGVDAAAAAGRRSSASSGPRPGARPTPPRVGHARALLRRRRRPARRRERSGCRTRRATSAGCSTT